MAPSLPVFRILSGLALAAFLLDGRAVHAQVPAFPISPAGQSRQTEETANTLPQSPRQPAVLDDDAIRKFIREELRRENGERLATEAKSDPALSKKASDWLEVGKDFQLQARWDNGFVAETKDQAFRLHIGGRLEFDNTWFTQNDNILIGSSAGQRLDDGTLLRRARMRADGVLWEFIDFVTEVNFATIQDVSNVDNSQVQIGSVGLTDFYAGFHDVPLVGNARFGHFKAPVGLERYTSSNDWYYMERSSLYDALLGPNNYQNGMLLFNSYWDDRVTLAGCLAWLSNATVQSFGFGGFETGQYGVSCRATALPIYENDGRCLVHVGVGYQHQAIFNNSFSVANRPLLRAGAGGSQTPNLLFTGTFFTPNGADIVDLEWAMVHGPFSMSAEYAVARGTNIFDSLNGNVFSGPRGSVTYQAAYVEAGWFITPGDYRRYDKKIGVWDRTIPQENAFLARGNDGSHFWGHGAVQLLARYTYLDLVSGDPVLTPTSGGARAGQQQDVTLGVNWYLNPQVFVMLNYVWTHLNSVVPGANGNLQGIGMRLHIDF
ncbi:MAG: hypothetical protein HY040_00510 [Planctomycetes bacterium]|nr:hypothetical protein [Planctomycetota bacterium]